MYLLSSADGKENCVTHPQRTISKVYIASNGKGTIFIFLNDLITFRKRFFLLLSRSQIDFTVVFSCNSEFAKCNPIEPMMGKWINGNHLKYVDFADNFVLIS